MTDERSPLPPVDWEAEEGRAESIIITALHGGSDSWLDPIPPTAQVNAAAAVLAQRQMRELTKMLTFLERTISHFAAAMKTK